VCVHKLEPVAVTVRDATLFRVANPLFGDGLAGGAQPLFPFVGRLWLLVGVQQVVPATGAATVLCLTKLTMPSRVLSPSSA
jgi:hypothetical protein